MTVVYRAGCLALVGVLAATAPFRAGDLPSLPAWPEELGRLDPLARDRALAIVERGIGADARSEGALEARYRRGLLRLEPVNGYDPVGARADLVAVSRAGAGGPWGGRARYALAWLLEQEGECDRARAAYQRIVVDEVGRAVAAPSRVGLARLLVRSGEPGEAARWVEEALGGGDELPDRVGASELRELAVRRLLERASGGVVRPDSRPHAMVLELPAVSGIAPTRGGGLVLADRKGERVIELDGSATPLGGWPLAGVEALAADAAGRIYAAADARVYRLDPGGVLSPLAELGDWAPVSGLAAGRGRLWVLDRRGRRIGRIDPGRSAPEPYWDSGAEARRLVAIAWDGLRLVGLDARTPALLAIDAAGVERPLAATTLLRPTALAADASGRLAVLDTRAGVVRFLDPDGALRFDWEFGRDGIGRPTDVAFAPDGSLHLYDESTRAWVRR